MRLYRGGAPPGLGALFVYLPECLLRHVLPCLGPPSAWDLPDRCPAR